MSQLNQVKNCCGPECCTDEKASEIQRNVKERYGAVAESTLSNQHVGVQAVAEAFGYTAEELSSIPADANMGLSCGNPTATAHLRQGEVVLDLGSGGGLDVFLAARQVGPTGKAIGIDMTPQMIERSRKNAAESGLTNVEFHQASIDKIPLADASVDCIISNCVINLAPDKDAVFREMFRVLKPGGRVAVSDIALKKELPPALAESVAAYVGCISGAISTEHFERGLKAAGFDSVLLVDSKSDLNAYAKVEGQAGCCTPQMDQPISLTVSNSCCGPAASEGDTSKQTLHGGLSEVLSKHDVNDYAASVKVFARKSL